MNMCFVEENSGLFLKVKGEFQNCTFNSIRMIGCEENIILWKIEQYYGQYNYFYTDLDGNLLFDGYLFSYATPFSNGCAFVKTYDFFIIDLRKKNFVQLPKELIIRNLNGFRQRQLVVLDDLQRQWGSYAYCSEDGSFQLHIPFIWDTLEFSRQPGVLYAGILRKRSFHFDGWHHQLEIPVCMMREHNAFDLNHYQKYLQFYSDEFYQEHFRYIREDLGVDGEDEIAKRLQECKMKAHNLSDCLFEEGNQVNTNSGEMEEVVRFCDYQKVLGKLRHLDRKNDLLME